MKQKSVCSAPHENAKLSTCGEEVIEKRSKVREKYTNEISRKYRRHKRRITRTFVQFEMAKHENVLHVEKETLQKIMVNVTMKIG